MDNNKLLSIKEVSVILGCSVQAVYNRLEKDFKPYLKTENGKKRLDNAVLTLINKPSVSSDLKENFKDILNLLEKQNSDISKQLEEKDKQLAAKDKQIEELTATIKIQAQGISAGQHNELAETLIDGQKSKLTDGADDKRKILATEADLSAPVKKQSVFSRIFKRN